RGYEHEHGDGREEDAERFHGRLSVASAIAGSSVTIPSTARAANRSIAAESFTVHTTTAASRSRAPSPTAADTSAWCSVRMRALAARSSRGPRAGMAARATAAEPVVNAPG